MADKAAGEWIKVTIERVNGTRTVETMKTVDGTFWETTFPGFNLDMVAGNEGTPATCEANLASIKDLFVHLKAGTDCAAVFSAINGL